MALDPEITKARNRERMRAARARVYAARPPGKTAEQRLENKRAKRRESRKRFRQNFPEKVREEKKLYRARRKAERPEADRLLTRKHRVWKEYRLEWPVYQSMVEKRGENCPVCGLRSKPVVDHDHATGLVRGLPCGHCNSAIGHARDNPQTLRRLADYLDTHAILT